MKTRLLLLLAAAFILLQCDKNGNPSTAKLQLRDGSSILSNADIHFFNTDNCSLVTSAKTDDNGEVNVDDLSRMDFIVVVQTATQTFARYTGVDEIFSGSTTTLQMDRLGSVSHNLIAPNELLNFVAGDPIDIEISFDNPYLCGSVFRYRIESDNGEIDVFGEIDSDNILRERITLTEKRLYELKVTAILFDQPLNDFPIQISNRGLPPLQVTFTTVDCEGVMVEWEKYEGNDFTSYDIWTNHDELATCQDLSIRYAVFDQNQTSYFDKDFPVRNDICYSVTVSTTNGQSNPEVNQPPVSNPIGTGFQVEAISPFFLNDKVFFTGQNSNLPDDRELRIIKGYDFVNQNEFESSVEFEPVVILSDMVPINGEPHFYINGFNKVHLINENLDLVNSSITGDFLTVGLTNNGFFAVQKINSEKFEIYNAINGTFVGETPEIDFSRFSKMYSLKGGKFAFVNDPFDQSNTYVVVVEINSDGTYAAHETYDLGENYEANGGVRYFDYQNDLLFLSNGAVFDANDDFKKVGQLFSADAFFQNMSSDGTYVSFFNPFEPTVSIFNISTFSKHKEVPVIAQTQEVYLDNGHVNMMTIRELTTAFKRVKID